MTLRSTLAEVVLPICAGALFASVAVSAIAFAPTSRTDVPFPKNAHAVQPSQARAFSWSHKLDQLYDIVSRANAAEDYEVSLQRVAFRPASDTSPGSMTIEGLMMLTSDVDAPANVSSFYRALTGDPENTGQPTPFFADFAYINNPSVPGQTLPNTTAFKYTLQRKP